MAGAAEIEIAKKLFAAWSSGDVDAPREFLTEAAKSLGIQTASCKNGEEALEHVRANSVDLVFTDLRMPGMSGVELVRRLNQEFPDMPVVMLSTYDNPTYVARSVALGASDFVLKGSSRDELIAAISRAAAHQSPSETSVMNRIRDTMSRRREAAPRTDVPLTNREMQVLRRVALGLSNREIGRSLDISIETVKEHVQNILRKIDASDL